MKWLKKKNVEALVDPIACQRMALDQVPDEVFSSKLLGDGLAIIPESGILRAPCACRVIQIFPTNHALGLLTDHGVEILIHVGIDTVELKGEGFKRLAGVGDHLKAGDPLIEIDVERIQSLGKSIATPIIITNMDKVKKLEVNCGDILMKITT